EKGLRPNPPQRDPRLRPTFFGSTAAGSSSGAAYPFVARSGFVDHESVEPFQPSLFQPETAFPKEKLATALRELANHGILIGTSSWRYEGWLGQLYTPERYYSRGRFSLAKFKEECIQEYAEVFPVVGGDFSFYAPPTPQFWQKLFASAPRALK